VTKGSGAFGFVFNFSYAAAVQLNMRSLIFLAALLPALAGAAVWPDALGAYHRTAAAKPSLSDQALWTELGLKDSEAATYENAKDKFSAIVYRLEDTTGALAAFYWQRPATATPSDLGNLAVETSQGLLLAHGNYLFSFQGYKPTTVELAPIFDALRDVDPTQLPTLPGFFPSQGLLANSERYVLGPAGLEKFHPGIPPSVAAFHLGAEAQIGVFGSPKGNVTLALFAYPTPQIAMQKVGDFQKLAGAMAKRSGPLVAVVLSPPDPDAAERLLAQVRYQAQIILDERVPKPNDNAGIMLTNIFVLTGILLVFCIIAGLFVGGFRTALLHGRKGRAADPMILLHLEEQSPAE
jgi:hypothetical protein